MARQERGVFYRVQPRGKSLFGHSSKLGSRPVAGIFAYRDPSTMFENYTWLHFRKRVDDYEMVVFAGSVVDSPEDSEGIVVVPRRELVRKPLRRWLADNGHAVG